MKCATELYVRGQQGTGKHKEKGIKCERGAEIGEKVYSDEKCQCLNLCDNKNWANFLYFFIFSVLIPRSYIDKRVHLYVYVP